MAMRVHHADRREGSILARHTAQTLHHTSGELRARRVRIVEHYFERGLFGYRLAEDGEHVARFNRQALALVTGAGYQAEARAGRLEMTLAAVFANQNGRLMAGIHVLQLVARRVDARIEPRHA